MPVRVEKDVLLTVPSAQPGSEGETVESIDLREGDREGFVSLHAPRHGTEVAIADLREACDVAEQELL